MKKNFIAAKVSTTQYKMKMKVKMKMKKQTPKLC